MENLNEKLHRYFIGYRLYCITENELQSFSKLFRLDIKISSKNKGEGEMLVKIIIGFFIIGIIEDYWDNKMKKEKHKKRKYRFIKGLVYSAAAIISYFLAGYVDKFIYVYAAVFVIGGIGSVLSSINPNLREMYSIGLVVFPTIWVISFYYESHKTIFTIIDVLLILTFLGAVGQGISNIKSGIDPDVEEEKNKKKWGRKLKRVKWFIKFWRWMG